MCNSPLAPGIRNHWQTPNYITVHLHHSHWLRQRRLRVAHTHEKANVLYYPLLTMATSLPGSLFEFHDKDLVISVLYILDLMLRAASPHYVASFASKLFLFFALGPYDATLVKVDDQPIMPGNGWMSLTLRVVDS